MSDTITRVRLSPRQWSILEAFISVPDKKHTDGGLQGHRRKWKEQIDARMRAEAIGRWDRGALPKTRPELCYIDLDTLEVEFIQRTIRNANAGGYQKDIATIFTDADPLFTGIPRIKKR